MTEVDNVTRADFLATLNKFAETAAKSEWATIYFAGHGLQLGGVYYLASRSEYSAAIEEASHESEPAE